jgi:hypothetical protein
LNTVDEARIYFQAQTVGRSPLNPSDLAAMRPALTACGMDWQHNSSGELRQRIFLPTFDLDPFAHAVDVEGNGSWVWVDRAPNLPLKPVNCGVPNSGTTVPNLGTVDLGPILAKLEALQGQIDQERAARIAGDDLSAIGIRELKTRVGVLEARPIISGCQASIAGIPIHCKVTN